MTQQTICRDCGAPGTVDVDDYAARVFHFPEKPFPWRCPACHAKHAAAESAKTEAEYKRNREEALNRRIKDANIPAEYFSILMPPVEIVANWLSARFDANILLHGLTGAGKSTSASYNAKQALFRGFSVKWYQLAALLDEWRLARCSDNPLDVPYLYRRIESYDLVILDECDKPVSTESTREMMFRLLEDVANGTSHCRLWMLGNWYRGAIEDIFGNGAAARRRFDESFQCAEITKDGKIKKIRLYRGEL